MKTTTIRCDGCGEVLDKSDDFVSQIHLGDRELDACSPKCLTNILVKEIEKADMSHSPAKIYWQGGKKR